MYVQTAYLIKPKQGLLIALQRQCEDLTELFNESRVILRKERYIWGNYTIEQWNQERTLEVKVQFLKFVIDDLIEEIRDQFKRTLGIMNAPEAQPEDLFDRWWTIERIEDICLFESLDRDAWNKPDEQ